MSALDPSLLSIVEASAAIADGSLSPVEIVEATLARIDAHDSEIHSFVTLAAAKAIDAARSAESDIRAGRWRGPMHGIPYGAKDIYDSAGIVTACQSRMRRNHVPAQNAACIDRMEESGAILIGKCATAEFGTGGPSPGMIFPPAVNPWDPERYTGGSST